MKSKFVLMRLFGASDPFKPITCMGGGGGGDTNSGGNDTLWNAQAEAAKQSTAMSGEMFDYWQKYSPTYLENASQMTNEAMDGTLTARMSDKALTDANAAVSTSNNDALRTLSTYGAVGDPSGAKAMDVINKNAINAASTRSNAANNAIQYGENQKWARNQDAFGMTSGMPGNAVAAANSAGGNMSSMAGMQNSSNNVAAQNAAGYGAMGATVASRLFKAEGGLIKAGEFKMRCGGAVKRADGGAIRLAAGGIPSNPVVGWRDRVAAMPTIGKTSNNSSPIANLVSGAAPTVATELAKPYLKEIGGSIKEGLGKAFGEVRNGAERLVGIDQTQPAAQVIDKSTGLGMAPEAAPVTGTETASLVNPATGAADAAYTAAANADAAVTGVSSVAEANTAAGALSGAGSSAAGGAMSALGTAMPWIGAGLALYSLFNDNAEGGSIERKDMTPGGEVEGPGTETSDSIPAWLSDEEYVLNAEAVKMVGKDKLDAINEAGLKERHGDQAVMVDGEAKPNGLAGGGMLGIAMGAGAQTYNQLQAQKEQTRRADEQLQAQKDQQKVQNDFAASNLELAKEQSKRQGEVQGVQLEAAKYTLDEKKQIGSILGTAKDGLQKIRSGDYSPLGDRAKPDMKPEEAANMFEGMIGEQMRHASPEFFTAAQTANQKAQHDAMLAKEKQADRDSTERRHQESLANARETANIRAGARAGSSKSAKQAGTPDFVKLANDTKIFGDDGVANVEVGRLAHDFYKSTSGEDTQRREIDALDAATKFKQKRDALVTQWQKDNPDKPMTEDQINDLVAPYSIDPKTGAALRKFTVNPADPSSGQYALSNTSNGGAPAVVREAIPNGLPAIISSITRGDLSDSDKEIWNTALAQKMSASGVSPAEQAKVLQQWGADGLTQYVNKYLPKTAAPTKEGGKGGVSASKERTPEEEAAYGKRAETPFESVVSGVKSIASKIGESDKAMVEKAEKQKFYGLKNMIQRRGLTDGEVKQYKELLSKYPELAEQTNVAAN